MNRWIFLLLMGLLAPSLAHSQAPFTYWLEPFTVPGWQGLQSFAVGHSGDHWLVLAGRTDGLHRRQPWAAFDPAGAHPQLRVVDPVAGELWTAPLSDLPVPLQEQLQATNLEFFQVGPYLYLVGGYGFSASQNQFVTHDRLTRVEVDSAVAAIKAGESLAPWFHSLQDSLFAVTGGYLGHIQDRFYLVGGHRFDGAYRPMGSTGFTQVYTEQVRSFSLQETETSLVLDSVTVWTDPAHLHRRDYNLLPQVFPDGRFGYTLFSGVFQKDADLPYLYPVDIYADGYVPQPQFSQQLNHYHCGSQAFFDAAENQMHSVFFGGMSQFYPDSAGNLQQDDNVPFVRTIGLVSRTAEGSLSEQWLGDMPGLLGSGAEFIPLPGLPLAAPDVVDLNQLPGDTVLTGYLAGGIESSAPNIFWINTGTKSEAFATLFRVYLVREQASAAPGPAPAAMSVRLFPNPARRQLTVEIEQAVPGPLRLRLLDMLGQEQYRTTQQAGAGMQRLHLPLPATPGVYLLNVQANGKQLTRRVVVE